MPSLWAVLPFVRLMGNLESIILSTAKCEATTGFILGIVGLAAAWMKIVIVYYL